VRDDRQRLLDVLEAIQRIERHTTQGRAAFERDELVQTWVVHHLQIIGEALSRLTPELRAAHPEVPWAQVVGMRNILVHHYFGIDADLVWSTVEREVPALKQAITTIVGAFPGGTA
jgi:uncharacterized protein with HEPN domain